MARETRRQRRDQRKSSGAAKPVAQRPRAQAPVRPGMQPASTQTGRREPRQRGRFVRESWAELKKVDWPGQHQLVQGTAVVIIACLITGVYLFLADELFRRFVQHVLLGG